MSEQNEKKWYVIRAISGKEKKVKEYLDAELSRNATLQDLISQVLIPTEKVYSVRNGKKVSKERNYLPGYVLIEANLDAEVTHLIKETPNVLGFLGTRGGDPDPLRPSEVSRILGKVDEMTEKGEGSELEFIVGETVTVNDGPFSSFSGIIEEVNEEKKKLKVMVKIFGRKTPLELSYFQVKRES
ncbi:MAG: transcription termination/antitermination factor NusG [Bacteroidales bacterium]|nr:transcription termination/antitermination factor NusG [Bacteroidales bacterium]